MIQFSRFSLLSYFLSFSSLKLRGAPVDAVPGVLGRDIVSKIPVLVYFLTTPAILLAVAASVPTAIVTP